MKNIFANWDLARTFYLLAGIWIMAQGVTDRLWFFVPVGLYFIYMAVFKKGCAGGNCEVNLEMNNDKNSK